MMTLDGPGVHRMTPAYQTASWNRYVVAYVQPELRAGYAHTKLLVREEGLEKKVANFSRSLQRVHSQTIPPSLRFDPFSASFITCELIVTA